MLSAATSTAPSASNRRTSTASRRAGGASRSIFEPASVLMPATLNRFFTAKGTPASVMRARRGLWSTALARLSARSASTAVQALICGSVAAMRSRLACTAARALKAPLRTARAMAVASINPSFIPPPAARRA